MRRERRGYESSFQVVSTVPVIVQLIAEQNARFCKSCIEQDTSRTITLKPPARKSTRKRNVQDYANLDAGLGSDSKRFLRMMEGKSILPHPFKLMNGGDVNLSWLEEDDTAMREPIIIEKPDGLGMKMPPSDFTADDVASELGEHTPLEVMGESESTLEHGLH
jgi:F-box/leucine-rich repeat protein 10/11